MKKITRSLGITMACISVAAGGLFLGYYIIGREYNQKPLENQDIIKSAINEDQRKNTELPDMNLDNDSHAPEIEADQNSLKINADTKLVYEYIYQEDGRVEQSEEEAPYFMFDKTQKELESTFPEWEIVQFEESEVIMRKTVSGISMQNYTIGIQDGYVAVFYQQSVDGSKLKEVTDTPLSALPVNDQERLEMGIDVSGEDELMRILEDYSS